MKTLWSSDKYVEANVPARLCIAMYGVELPLDAMAFWIDEYAGNEARSALIRELWNVICEYVIAPDPVPSELKSTVAGWYHVVGCLKQLSNCARDNECAIWLYTRALSIVGNPWQGALVDRSFTYSKLHRFNEALVDADSSFDAGGGMTHEWSSCLAKGEALFGLGHYQAALTYLEIARDNAQKSWFRFPSIGHRIAQIQSLTSTPSTPALPGVARTDTIIATNLVGATKAAGAIPPVNAAGARTNKKKRRR